MIEIPESRLLAEQFRQTLLGRRMERVLVNSSPHKFAFWYKDPADYPALLEGRRFTAAGARGGMAELDAEGAALVFSDGTCVRYYQPGEKLPVKNQLDVTLDNGARIVCTIQMYGGLWAFPEGENDSGYYRVAGAKPSPLADDFDPAYFEKLRAGTKPGISVKAFLATEQRIPGLGNGVLQDILFRARFHPRAKLDTLSDAGLETLYRSVKDTLLAMTLQGGRDTETDLFGDPGGYATVLSNKTYALPCPVCGGGIQRQAYLGGNVYFCPNCQPLSN